MLKRTVLFDLHIQSGAKIVPFSDWEMPIHYGSQVSEHHVVRQDAGMFDVSYMTIIECNLAWTVAFRSHDRAFIGRDALLAEQKTGSVQALAGKGVLRYGQKVMTQEIGEGVITSGSFSPTLLKGIALALVPPNNAVRCDVDVRGKNIEAHIVKPSFVCKGQVTKAIHSL